MVSTGSLSSTDSMSIVPVLLINTSPLVRTSLTLCGHLHLYSEGWSWKHKHKKSSNQWCIILCDHTSTQLTTFIIALGKMWMVYYVCMKNFMTPATFNWDVWIIVLFLVVTILIMLLMKCHNSSAGCPIGSYLAQTSPGNTVCRPCPNNSISVFPDSHVCECLQGYHRNPLEDIHVPCTSELL